MSATARQEKNQEFDSVKSILIELIAIYKQQTEIRETLDAKGVPPASVNMLSNLQATGSTAEFKKLCTSAVNVAFERFGGSAVKLTELENSCRTLVEFDEDALYVRRIAKGMELHPQALSMLTNIILKNPGDNGQKVLTELFNYSSEYGIRLQGLRMVEGGNVEPPSVLPDIEIPDTRKEGIAKYKSLVIELVLAAIVTYTVLTLLT